MYKHVHKHMCVYVHAYTSTNIIKLVTACKITEKKRKHFGKIILCLTTISSHMR